MKKKFIILYYSKDGNTHQLAKRFWDIFREFIPNRYEIEMMKAQEMNIESLRASIGIIVGSPDYYSYVAGQIKIFFDEILEYKKNFKGKPAIGFITHGGGGDAANSLQDLLSYLKFDVIKPIISVKEDNITSKIESQIQKSLMKMLKIAEDSD
ncbi:flavodoxin family protein [Promethearchaeum syntrophicum]|uniref:Flavodoxin family protein n=1 Tax=Promethearchaeum syntrophicum TaxID=2594042 RepID=A0A5B9DEW8_9ARCH|nr:flavodoxin domain-containing protein [Candidatus Prometheoarchaeum syntrophicum]QEE17674.1 NAD(P)H dehydrogenase (quinone) [Candidatus Prometheoarchaeum syntrophicum]